MKIKLSVEGYYFEYTTGKEGKRIATLYKNEEQVKQIITSGGFTKDMNHQQVINFFETWLWINNKALPHIKENRL